MLKNAFLKPCLVTTLRIKDCYQIQIIHVLQMQIWQIRKDWPQVKPCLITLGSFDGLHRGHQALLTDLVAESSQLGLASAALTFTPHPRQLLSGDSAESAGSTSIETIAPLDWVKEYWDRLRVDHLFVKNIDREFLKKSATEFLEDLRAHIPVKGFVVGYDVGFGAHREGNAAFLRSYCKQNNLFFKQVSALQEQDEVISSRGLRQLIQDRNFEKLESFLNRRYFIEGEVVQGAKLGTKLGFPTANLNLPQSVCLPRGVFAGQCLMQGEWHWGAANIGVRPTLGQELHLQCEIHVLDFKKDVYGQKLRFEFDHLIREEKKFSGLDELKEQIRLDVENLRRWSSYKKRHSNIF